MAIYKVDYGCIWYFDARDEADAKDKWIATCLEQGYSSVKEVLDEFGQPDIRRVQPVDAVQVKVTLEDEQDRCPKCSGTGQINAERTLLAVWQKEQDLPESKKSHNGILCCSEW